MRTYQSVINLCKREDAWTRIYIIFLYYNLHRISSIVWSYFLIGWHSYVWWWVIFQVLALLEVVLPIYIYNTLIVTIVLSLFFFVLFCMMLYENPGTFWHMHPHGWVRSSWDRLSINRLFTVHFYLRKYRCCDQTLTWRHNNKIEVTEHNTYTLWLKILLST